MRRVSLLFVLAALLGASQYSHAQCSDDSDTEEGSCVKSRCSVICSDGGINLLQSSAPTNKPLIAALHRVEMKIAALKMAALDGKPKGGPAESKLFDRRHVPVPATRSEISLDAPQSIRRRTL